jgi:hypothetical protein
MSAGENFSPLIFRKPAPDSIRLLDGKGMSSTLSNNRTCTADSFCCYLTGLSARATFILWMEEHIGRQ